MVTKSKILLLNSPKGVGKTEAVKYLKQKGICSHSAECKSSLHSLTMKLFGVSEERYWGIYNNRELKEIPLPDFACKPITSEKVYLEKLFGVNCQDLSSVQLSIRQAMIYVSEVLVKERFGEDWFGLERVRGIMENSGAELFIDDSAAFVSELPPLIDYIGQENILLLRLHRDGYTFEGDSRSYIPDGVINNTIDVYNNGKEIDFYDSIFSIVTRWLNDLENS